ncbi:hypothetical protein IQ238_03790 [Pleurocapsales cyanobacterium LEGE 06147]|nr:hypothetical protein [Pleurocapsales cyanobacterium LEGE 06147]
MESPKVINKVLLSSVAFGVSFGIGMLVSEKDIKNALTTGALAATAGFAGALVSERKKADGENLVEDSLQTQVQELKTQEDWLHQSIAEATTKMQEVEAGINSLQTEHAQLLENIADLNSQKQQLETEYNNWQAQVREVFQQQEQTNQTLSSLETQKEAIETSIATRQTELEQIRDRLMQAQQQQEELDTYLARLESRKQELETENQNLQAQIQELEQQHAQLAQVIAPLAEEPAESETFEDRSNEELEELIGLEELDNFSKEELVSVAVKLTDEESISVENPMDEMEEIAFQEEPIFLEDLDSIDEQESVNEESEPFLSLIELESTPENSKELDNLFDGNPIADDDSFREELAQPESTTEDFVLLDESIEPSEEIACEEPISLEELDSIDEEAIASMTEFESAAENSEGLDNLLDSTNTFDSQFLEQLMDETAELSILDLDLVEELAQPKSPESTTEESVTLENLMSEAEIASPVKSRAAQTELTNELDDHFFSFINEATEEETTNTGQESEQLDFLISSSYTSESRELEITSTESGFLENSIDRAEENFLENFESLEKLPETEIDESSTIDHFLTENLDLENSFDRWEETSEELGQLDDLSTSMSEYSMQGKLEEVEEKLCELNSISEASLEEFEDLLESMEEQNSSISFSDDVDDIETTKTQNLWD